jgi:hypothetical protein
MLLGLMVFSPAWVIAAITMKRESTYETLPCGVENCQKMIDDTMHIVMK